MVGGMAVIRFLVVDDSIFMRKALSKVLEGDPGIQVVGQARDGRNPPVTRLVSFFWGRLDRRPARGSDRRINACSRML